jgi:hypothetical protein
MAPAVGVLLSERQTMARLSGTLCRGARLPGLTPWSDSARSGSPGPIAFIWRSSAFLWASDSEAGYEQLCRTAATHRKPLSLIRRGWGAQNDGVSIMMRKIAIGLAAAAIAIGGSTLSASAAKGGGGGGPHGRTVMAGGPHGGGGGYKRPSTGRAYGMGPRAYAFHGRGFEHRRPYRYDYRRPYRYGYYKSYPSYGGSCWTRVWTPDGWSSKYVCGYGRPSYGGRYSYNRPYSRYGHYRPYGGPRYGGGHSRPSYGRR